MEGLLCQLQKPQTVIQAINLSVEAKANYVPGVSGHLCS